MEVRTKSPQKTHFVDAETVLLVPQDLEHDDEGMASIYDTMALYPTADFVKAAAKKLGLSADKVERLDKECIKIRRNKKLDQYVQEYFFERVLSKRAAEDEDASFLARRILDETLRTIFPEAKIPDSKPEAKPAVESVIKALRFIEANLFEELEVEDICKRSGASVSTLLRNFKADLKTTPYAYIKNRRLEEAHRLLSLGKHGVAEVAVLVGYGNFGAFTDAFKSKFGMPPSKIRA